MLSLPIVVAVALGVVGPTVVLLRWVVAPPPGMHVSGMFQGDMPTYFCYARAAASSPTLLTWASPHDLRAAPVPVFLNLPITLLGWLVSTGIDLGILETSLHVVLGMAMYVALARLCARFFPRGPWLTTAFLVTPFAGGVASLAELRRAVNGVAAWSRHIQSREEPYYWWFLGAMLIAPGATRRQRFVAILLAAMLVLYLEVRIPAIAITRFGASR